MSDKTFFLIAMFVTFIIGSFTGAWNMYRSMRTKAEFQEARIMSLEKNVRDMSLQKENLIILSPENAEAVAKKLMEMRLKAELKNEN